jgi:hypothetical protein
MFLYKTHTNIFINTPQLISLPLTTFKNKEIIQPWQNIMKKGQRARNLLPNI